MNDEAGALGWAQQLKLGNTLFKYVKIGQQFRFKESGLFTKTSARWYIAADGRKFTTGQNTAVFIKETLS